MSALDRPIRRVGYAVIGLMLVLVVQLVHLQVVDSKKLTDDPQNIRKTIRDFARPRGKILTVDGQVVAQSVVAPDQFRRQRQYLLGDPAGSLFAGVTGYFSFIFGTTGIENTYNDWLAGRKTTELALNSPGDFLTGQDLVGDVVMSLDSRVQQAARDALGDRQGSVLVMNARTGAMVAMYSNPTYDPNALAGHDYDRTQAIFTFLNALPTNPLLMRAYRERFPPGSTFKIVTTTSALDFNIATPTEPDYPKVRSIGLPDTTAELNNFGGKRCGGNLTESFIESCNTTFGMIGLQLGNNLAVGNAKWGIGVSQEAPPIDLPSAASSIGPVFGTFERNKPAFAQAAIGQNEVATTPLQMLLTAAGIANGGVVMAPHTVQEIKGPDGKVVKTIEPQVWKTATSPETAATITEMMLGVVQHGTGTAAAIPGVAVAGKTGTAQTVAGARPHAWFVGFAPANAPADQPVYAFAVLVENAGSNQNEATGGAVAAPIAKAVLAPLLGR